MENMIILTIKQKLLILLGGIALIVLLGLTSVVTGSFENNSSKSSELGYFSESPNGASGGAIIPASCESGFGEGGFPHFAGDSAGSCITTAPPSQPPTGGGGGSCLCNSPANSCGATNQGLKACGSVTCPVPVPSDSSCGASNISTGIIAPIINVDGSSSFEKPRNEQTVNKGQSCTIYVVANPATSCTVKGPGISTVTLFGSSGNVTGSVTTARIGVDTVGSSIYTITCKNGSVVSNSTKFTCRLNPIYQEVN